MKLAIKLDYSRSLVLPAEDAGTIVPAFGRGVLMEKHYPSKTWKPCDTQDVEFGFEAESMFVEAPEPLAKIQASRDESEKKYLEQWTKTSVAEKKVKELEETIAKMKAAVSTASPEPVAAGDDTIF